MTGKRVVRCLADAEAPVERSDIGGREDLGRILTR